MRTSSRSVSHLVVWLVPALLAYAGEAKATDATEFPDNGSEQGGRGGAWVARASDPLASFYNPAGLAGQPTRLILQANFGSQHTCFSRIKAMNDATLDGVNAGGSYPQVCSSGAYTVDPQLAMTFRITPRIGIGIAPFLGPSSAAGTASYPEFATVGGMPNSPEPGRYLLTAQNALLVTPTIGIGAEIIDRLRVGASFQWGLATFSYTSASVTLTQAETTTGPAANDLLAKLSGHDYFIPGFTLGALYSPTDLLDVAGWFKWSGPVSATGDVQAQYPYFQDRPSGITPSLTDTSQPNCGFVKTGSPCGSGGNASVHLSRPMEAKLGLRFHLPRKNIPYDEHLRDPMAQDIFDFEVDGTFAANSAMNQLSITFPSTPSAGGTTVGKLPVNLGSSGQSVVPPSANIPLNYTNVYGIRLGGDYNVLPDQLALRGGFFYQSPAQTAQQYQSLAFAAGSMTGLTVGATYRIHFGPGSNALELSAGYEHVFVGSESTTDGQVFGLAGTPCETSAMANGQCPGGAQRYRTPWAVNDGTITNSINVINAGLGYRF